MIFVSLAGAFALMPGFHGAVGAFSFCSFPRLFLVFAVDDRSWTIMDRDPDGRSCIRIVRKQVEEEEKCKDHFFQRWVFAGAQDSGQWRNVLR